AGAAPGIEAGAPSTAAGADAPGAPAAAARSASGALVPCASPRGAVAGAGSPARTSWTLRRTRGRGGSEGATGGVEVDRAVEGGDAGAAGAGVEDAPLASA